MDGEQAARVRAGDVAVYRRGRHRVLAVHGDGFWAPYFELDGAGLVGHALIDSVEIQSTVDVRALRSVRRTAAPRTGAVRVRALPEVGV